MLNERNPTMLSEQLYVITYQDEYEVLEVFGNARLAGLLMQVSGKKLPFQSTATDVIFTIETLIGKTHQKIRLRKEKKLHKPFFSQFLLNLGYLDLDAGI